MKSIKKFEAFEGEEEGNVRGWKDDLLTMYDYFAELEDSTEIDRIDYQAGYRESSGGLSYDCYLKVSDVKGEEIVGRQDMIEHKLIVNSKILLRATLFMKYKNSNYSPFKYSWMTSFFADNADNFLDVMNKVNLVRKRFNQKYNIGITLDNDKIHINFLEK